MRVERALCHMHGCSGVDYSELEERIVPYGSDILGSVVEYTSYLLGFEAWIDAVD